MNPLAPLNLSLIQFPIQWENKETSFREIENHFKEVRENTHIIILPEMFATGFSMNTEELAERMNGETIQWMKNHAMNMRKIICGSMIIKEDDNYFNRLIWMLPNGECHHYDKYHLFSKADEDKYYQAGNKKLIVQVNGWKLFLQTCYDLRFPVFSRQGNELYDVLINVAQWPAIRSDAFVSLLKARAIENQCFVIAVNGFGYDGNEMYYSGNSSVYQFDGKKIDELADKSGVLNITLHHNELMDFREKFPFLKDRDKFIMLSDE